MFNDAGWNPPHVSNQYRRLALSFDVIFLSVIGRVLNVSTILDYSYSQTWFTTFYTDSVVLRIKACKDAHILFSDAIGMGSNMYEVALGINGNTESVIREGPYHANVVWIRTPDILDCDRYR